MLVDGSVQSGPDWDGHVMLLHSTEAERLAGVTAWVRRGLELGEKVIYTESGARRQSLFDTLEERGVDVKAAAADGLLVVLPVEELYPPNGQDQVVDRALAEGFASVRMSAEAKAALTIVSAETYAAAERNIDRLCRTRPVSAMCQYARMTTSGQLLRESVAVHQTGVRETGLGIFSGERATALRGEIDLANVDVLAAALEALTSTKERVVRLDFRQVEFVGAAGCRVLVTASASFREAGGCLVVVAPQPHVERTMRLLGVDELPGIRLVGDG